MIPETLHISQYHIRNVAAASALTAACIWLFAIVLRRWNISKQSKAPVGHKPEKPTRKYGGKDLYSRFRAKN
jgi:hypothetical protein